MKRTVLALVLLAVATSAAAQMLPNTCANPYWANTMRCKAFPGLPPQENLGTVPLAAADVKAFTRVFLLADPTVRCTDGTRPLIYIDRAASGVTNNWIFTMTGGGGLHAVDTDGNGIADDAQRFADTYADAGERDEMGTAHEPPMKNLFGIHSPDTALNPTFANYNRVRIEKCSYDRYLGTVSYIAPAGFFTVNGPGGAVTIDLWQQGSLIVQEALELLMGGLTFNTWSLDAAGQVTATTETLPPLADAEKVLFIGHSGAAHGLMQNIDNISAFLAAQPGFAGDVRALFDANFLPSNENEVAFNAGGDAYDGVTAGTTTGALNTFSYDGAVAWSTGMIAEQYDEWNALLDQSCLAAHAAAGDTWQCNDRHHVLLNHIATPFFIREDFTDPNPEHLPPTCYGPQHDLQWADRANYPHCSIGATCMPRVNKVEYRDRLMTQFEAMLDYSLTDSELATGTDPSLVGVGLFPTIHVWMPDCTKHEGAYDNDSFFNTDMTYLAFTYSMRTWLEGFMSLAQRVDLRSWRVDGWADGAGNTMGTTCP